MMRFATVLPSLLIASVAFACTSVSHSPSGSDPTLSPLSQKPLARDASYTQNFKELPLVASLSRLPWPSDAWSSVHGGSSFRWQLAVASESDELEDLSPFIQYPLGQSKEIDSKKLSPTEKMDLFLASPDWAMTKKERKRTLEQTNSDGSLRKEIPEWEGIMHAWSVASLQFEPVGPVTVQSKDGKAVTFDTQDIYSLLSLYVHEQSPKPLVLASLCDKQSGFDKQEIAAAAGPYGFENSKQSYRRKGCEKIDAATFHMVLANQIGKLNEGFVMDRDYQGEISNNPVVAYESRIIDAPGKTPLSIANVSRTVRVRTIVFLTADTPVVNLDEEDASYPYDSENYEYELDLDPHGKILAGRWTSASQSDVNSAIPDFMWKSSPVWLNGPLKTVYEKARENYVSHQSRQLRPIEDMPLDERRSLDSYFSNSKTPGPSAR
jgi:hypothetical protein